ncbi:MAG: hypothetical protein QXN59_02150 [Candidatus Micrarchaeaceae archaeon]
MSFFGNIFRRSKIVSSIKSGSNNISVVESGDSRVRELLYNGVVYSRFRRGELYTGSYWDYLLPPAFAFEKPKVLVIGLGGGTVQYQLGKILGKNAVVDTVESDQKIIDIWRRFFPKAGSRVFNWDGSDFVKHKQNSYDVIILDAYQDLEIPRSFIADSFIDDAHKCLKDKGVLAINFAQSVGRREEMLSYIGKLKRRFIVRIVKAGSFSDNVVIVCMKNISPEGFLTRASEMMQGQKSVMKAYLSWREL